MKKSLNLTIAGTGETKELAIEKNCTVGDLLEQLDLRDYQVTQGDGKPPLPKKFDLSQLPDGTTLFASTVADAGVHLILERGEDHAFRTVSRC
jgi:hypothetical protein